MMKIFISNINEEMVGSNPAFLSTVPRPGLGGVVGCRKHDQVGRGWDMRHGSMQVGGKDMHAWEK